jgi:hypothetical protein
MSKRSREGTPLKENKFKHLQEKMGKDLEGRLANLTGALGNVKKDKIKDLKDSILEVMKKFVVPVLEAQGTMVSDLISQIIELETRLVMNCWRARRGSRTWRTVGKRLRSKFPGRI